MGDMSNPESVALSDMNLESNTTEDTCHPSGNSKYVETKDSDLVKAKECKSTLSNDNTMTPKKSRRKDKKEDKKENKPENKKEDKETVIGIEAVSEEKSKETELTENNGVNGEEKCDG